MPPLSHLWITQDDSVGCAYARTEYAAVAASDVRPRLSVTVATTFCAPVFCRTGVVVVCVVYVLPSAVVLYVLIGEP